jgi:hypothetical protein
MVGIIILFQSYNNTFSEVNIVSQNTEVIKNFSKAYKNY